MENYMHIVLSSDENYAEFVAVVIVSLFENNQGKNICIHLLSNNISHETLNKIGRHIPKVNGKLIIYDVSNTREILGSNLPDTISIASYSRLILQNLLPANVERALYLDTDIVCNGDISELWKVDLSGYWVAGVLDIWPGIKMKGAVGLRPMDSYINAGMLLINLKEWREFNVESKIVEFIHQHNGHVYHHDQGIINGVCKGKMMLLHPKYNVTSNYFTHPYKYIAKYIHPFYSQEEFLDAKKHPLIIHYTPGLLDRPWTSGSKHPLLSIYQSFHQKTEWKDANLRTPYVSFPLRLMRFIYQYLPFQVYWFVSKSRC